MMQIPKPETNHLRGKYPHYKYTRKNIPLWVSKMTALFTELEIVSCIQPRVPILDENAAPVMDNSEPPIPTYENDEDRNMAKAFVILDQCCGPQEKLKIVGCNGNPRNVWNILTRPMQRGSASRLNQLRILDSQLRKIDIISCQNDIDIYCARQTAVFIQIANLGEPKNDGQKLNEFLSGLKTPNFQDRIDKICAGEFSYTDAINFIIDTEERRNLTMGNAKREGGYEPLEIFEVDSTQDLCRKFAKTGVCKYFGCKWKHPGRAPNYLENLKKSKERAKTIKKKKSRYGCRQHQQWSRFEETNEWI
jgi:hypothetical protein